MLLYFASKEVFRALEKIDYRSQHVIVLWTIYSAEF